MTHEAPPSVGQEAAPEIGTAEVRADPTVNPHTGEPRRPWPVLVATPLLYLGVASVVVGLLWTFWWSIPDFAGAAWLHAQFETGPGDLLRVGLVSAEFAMVIAIGTMALITGYYAWWGYRWSRWWGVIAAVVSGGAWLLNPIAGGGSVAIILGAALLWLPQVAAFDGRWHDRRHPPRPAPDIRDDVHYGPLPRYR